MNYAHYLLILITSDEIGIGASLRLGSPILEKCEDGHPHTMVNIGQFWGIEVTLLTVQIKLGILISKA